MSVPCTCPSGDGSLRWPCPHPGHHGEGVPAIQAERELVEAVDTLTVLVNRWGLSWDEDALSLVRRALVDCQAIPDTESTNGAEVAR